MNAGSNLVNSAVVPQRFVGVLMVYRDTPQTRVRAANRRQAILDAAIHTVSRSGFSGASVREIAARAEVSTGSVYSYFGNRDELLTEVFRVVSGCELEYAREALEQPGADFLTRLESFIDTFAGRAFRGRRMAEALLFEPVSPAIEGERLAMRRRHHHFFADAITTAVDFGELPEQDAALAARAVIGAISENLVGRLTSPHHGPDDDGAVTAYLLAFCIRALGAKT